MSDRFKFIIAMIIFGTIGLFVKQIGLPAYEIVFVRCALGGLILLLVAAYKGSLSRKNRNAIKRELKSLIMSGLFLGFNWFFLYRAFAVSSVSISVIIYYLAPVVVMILSPFISGESLRFKNIIAIILAILGLIIITATKGEGNINFEGLIYALLSAVFYAGLMITNQRIKGVDGLLQTVISLLIAAVIMFIYTIFSNEIVLAVDFRSIFYLIVICVLHTGVACYIYFSTMGKIGAQSTAILSYIDPMTALIASGLFLHERLILIQWVGVAMILGSTLIQELKFKRI